MNLLIVDGDSLSLNVLIKALTLTGATCLGLKKAETALNVLKSGQHFDAILFDYQSLEMSGDQFYQELRAQDPEASLVVITDFPESVHSRISGRIEAAGIFRKPVPFNKMMKTLKTICSGASDSYQIENLAIQGS